MQVGLNISTGNTIETEINSVENTILAKHVRAGPAQMLSCSILIDSVLMLHMNGKINLTCHNNSNLHDVVFNDSMSPNMCMIKID
jgi:hypothetical protein